MASDGCFICRKHRGREQAPPGGYILEGSHWMLCHAPAAKGPVGTLFMEARRHVLDFRDFTDEEAQSFGVLARRVYSALGARLHPERIYQVSMMEGIPHFHAWIIPRSPEIVEKGVAFLARDLPCTEEAAADMAAALRTDMRTS